MNSKDELLLFDLSSIDLPVNSVGKPLFSLAMKSLGAFSKQEPDYDDFVETGVLIRQMEAITKELYKRLRDREERVVSEENPYLNVEEVAQILRVSPETVREEINAGKIPASKIGKRNQNRILKSDLAKYLGVKKIIFTQSNTSSGLSN